MVTNAEGSQAPEGAVTRHSPTCAGRGVSETHGALTVCHDFELEARDNICNSL